MAGKQGDQPGANLRLGNRVGGQRADVVEQGNTDLLLGQQRHIRRVDGQHPVVFGDAPAVQAVLDPTHRIAALDTGRRGMHPCEAFRLSQLLVSILPCIVLDNQVMGHILGGGDHPAAAAQVTVDLRIWDSRPKCHQVTLCQAAGFMLAFLECHRAHGMLHIQRLKNARFQIFREGLAADHFHDPRQSAVIGVKVMVFRAGLGHRARGAQAGYPLCDGSRLGLLQIGVAIFRQAAGLVEQVANGD